MAQPLYLPLVLLAAVLGMGVAFVAWLRGDRPGARPLTLFVVAASLWAVAEGLSLASAGLDSVRFWKQVGFTLSAVIPVTWLVTVLEYTGTEEWLDRRSLAALLAEPAVFVTLVWTNETHGLVWTSGHREFVGAYSTFGLDFGLAFWAHQVYTYLLVTAGALLLVRIILRTDTLYRRQSTALLIAVALPLVGNALYAFGLLPGGLDPTGVMYVVAGIVLALAMFRSQLLRIAPAIRDLGREELLSELEEPVLIVDRDDRLVEMNSAGEELVAEDEESLGRKLEDCCADLAAALQETDEKTQLRLDRDGDVRYYDVRVSDLSRGRGSVSGRLVSLRDVTEQRQREQRLDVLNRIFRHNIRNELNVVRGNVDMVRRDLTDDALTTRLDAAIETIDGVVERSNKLNTLSRLFDAETDGTIDLTTHLESERIKWNHAHPDATIDLDVPDTLEVATGPSVVAVFDELVANAVEHTDGESTVCLGIDERASDDDEVVVEVEDDGPGINEQELHVLRVGRESALEHGSGVGLWLANWVTERNGGTLSFSNTTAGTTVRIRLPRPGAKRESAEVVEGESDTEATATGHSTSGASNEPSARSREH